MTVAERILTEAIDNLTEARQRVQALAGCTPDWSAGIAIETEFLHLEEIVREFGRCQFGESLNRCECDGIE